VEKNLEQNEIRVIIAGDEIRPEVRRIVEFLNSEMEHVEVLALEVQCYAGDNDDPAVFVSQIIGQTQRTADRRAGSRTGSLWPPERLEAEFFRVIEPRNPKLVQRLRSLLQAMIQAGVFVETYAKTPTFSAVAPSGARAMSIQQGIPHWMFEEVRYRFDGGAELLQWMTSELRELGMADSTFDGGKSRNLLRKLDDLTDDEFDRFIGVATYQMPRDDGS
jgi:hypothetical protein